MKTSNALPYPLKVVIFRDLPADYRGKVHVWDVDKTYLDTHFSSFRGMARIPVEFSVDKKAIPGMPEILRGLRWGNGETTYTGTPLFFVTASPSAMEGVLRRKMLLDGVEYDGLVMKDWLGCLKQFRPGRLREQLGFKVCALLTLRLIHKHAFEYLYGDDTESDPQAYALYADLLNGDLSAGEAEIRMESLGISKDDRRCVQELLDRLGQVKGRVERAFIHLERGTPPSRYFNLGPVITPVRGAGQLALALYEQRLITMDAVTRTMAACETSPRWRVTQEMVLDAIERGLIHETTWNLVGGTGDKR